MSSRLVFLIPLLPLLGFVLAGLFGKRLGKRFVSFVCCGVVAAAFLLALALFVGHQAPAHGEHAVGSGYQAVVAYEWIQAGDLSIQVSFLVDPLSLIMLLVVTGIGFLIHLYSTGYMHHDPGYHRYFAYLNLFLFFMLILVLGDNLPLVFVGWEGVGLCSYLLIGFWYQKPSAADAGMKAFLVNRIGDFGFLLAVLTIWSVFGTLSFSEMAVRAPGVAAAQGSAAITAICLLTFLGATGKSAQIPLFVWLPDAMEGPTPVSALIHAATMVTSGVYLIARMSALFVWSPEAMGVIAIVGCATALFAATIALTQTDIKRVLAYSTVSQLGYMFLALGLGAFGAAVFHLMTHAFFKACLFLGSGSVIHAMSGEQDMRRMGGLKQHLPHTYRTFLIATLAISGIFPLAGFFSKDEILWNAFGFGRYGLWALGFVTAGMTAFYMFRLVFMTFHQEERFTDEVRSHLHESPWTMTLPLWILAGGSAVVGLVGIPAALGHPLGLHNYWEHWLHPVLSEVPGRTAVFGHGVEILLAALSVGWAVCAILVARSMYQRSGATPGRLAAAAPRLYRGSLHKWYVDEIYGATVVRPLLAGARFLWRWIDEIVIDGIVNLVGLLSQVLGEVLRAFQTGLVRNYALFVALGVASVLILMVVF